MPVFKLLSPDGEIVVFKLLALIVLLALGGWIVKYQIQMRLRRARGEPMPEQRGPRPITVIGVALVAIYGAFLLWRLIDSMILN